MESLIHQNPFMGFCVQKISKKQRDFLVKKTGGCLYMAIYKCFSCGKQISHKTLEKRFVCPTCGSKIFYKPRKDITKVKAE